MDNGFSILMFIFGAAMLLYAAIMAITKNYNMLPYRARVSVKPKDPKKYMTQLAGAVALAAVPILLGGAVGLWNVLAGLAVMIVGMVACLYLATRIVKNR